MTVAGHLCSGPGPSPVEGGGRGAVMSKTPCPQGLQHSFLEGPLPTAAVTTVRRSEQVGADETQCAGGVRGCWQLG